MFRRKKRHQYVNSYFKPVNSMKIDSIIKEAIPDVKPDNNNSKNSGLTDAEGLSKAYNSPTSIFLLMVIKCISQELTPLKMFMIGN